MFTYSINAVCIASIMRVTNYIDLNWAGGTIRELRFLRNDIIMLAALAVFMPFIIRFYKYILKPALISVDSDIFRIIWFIPSSFLFLNYLSSSIVSFDNMLNKTFLPITILIFSGMLISCFVLLKTLRQSAENATLKENARMTQQQLVLQGEQYKMLTENITNDKVTQHDFRHHLSVIKAYSDSGDNKALQKYLADYESSLPDDSGGVYCENHAVNAVVRYYICKANELGIDVSVKINIPKIMSINDLDLCVIFGNCLENAVEACSRLCEGNRYIKLRTRLEMQKLGITIDNSFDGEIHKENGIFMSRKHECAGIGLSSVAAAAKKYVGTAIFETVGNEFRSSILLFVPTEHK